jgi:hypothetical protein
MLFARSRIPRQRAVMWTLQTALKLREKRAGYDEFDAGEPNR